MPRRYDRANGGRLQERRGGGAPKFARDGPSMIPARQKMQRHEIVREIIIRPNFRPATALLNCDKRITALARSFQPRIPQPPAPRGSRDRACSQDSLSPSWANESWSFFFLGWPSFQGARWREPATSSHKVLDSGLTRR